MADKCYLAKGMESLLKFIYRLPEPSQRRHTRPLQLLCLGPARSGTDSLRKALLTLGYEKVYHGFVWWIQHIDDSHYLYHLAKKKIAGQPITRVELDHVFGDYEALTDIPAAWFATDLLRAYPKAKVILNRRRDVHEWQHSFRDSVLPMMTSWTYWWTSFFDARLFWGLGLTDLMWMRFYFQNDFEKNAIRAHDWHFEQIEDAVEEQGRSALKWSVEDGWYDRLHRDVCKALSRSVQPANRCPGSRCASFLTRRCRKKHSLLVMLRPTSCQEQWPWTGTEWRMLEPMRSSLPL
jgi:hypothetical protein